MSPSETPEVSVPSPWLTAVTTAIEHVPPEPGYVPDPVRQQMVLARLPDTLILELNAHRFASDLEQRFHEDRLGLPHSEQNEDMVIRGKVFELLVAADPAIHTPSPAAEELLALLHDPDRFALAEALGYPRNPDMAFLVVAVHDGAIVIKAAGECKLGRLNARSLKQLDDGFLRGIKKAIQLLNERGDLGSHGLIELARAKQHCRQPEFLRLAPDFRVILVVPANRDTSDPDALVKTEELAPEERSRLRTILGDEEAVTIRKAAFSAAEVAAVTQTLADLIR